jgi:hypothetical protein
MRWSSISSTSGSCSSTSIAPYIESTSITSGGSCFKTLNFEEAAAVGFAFALPFPFAAVAPPFPCPFTPSFAAAAFFDPAIFVGMWSNTSTSLSSLSSTETALRSSSSTGSSSRVDIGFALGFREAAVPRALFLGGGTSRTSSPSDSSCKLWAGRFLLPAFGACPAPAAFEGPASAVRLLFGFDGAGFNLGIFGVSAARPPASAGLMETIQSRKVLDKE